MNLVKHGSKVNALPDELSFLCSKALRTGSRFLPTRSRSDPRTLLLELNNPTGHHVRNSADANVLFIEGDSREGRPGIPFRLALTVIDTRSCAPVPNAVVDLWHCDAAGLYSHYIASSLGQMGGPTDNTTFFRGEQTTLLIISTYEQS